MEKNEKDGIAKCCKAIGLVVRGLFNHGTYRSTATNTVSKTRPKLPIVFLIPCCEIDRFLVLQIIKSDHCTTTMDTKYPD